MVAQPSRGNFNYACRCRHCGAQTLCWLKALRARVRRLSSGSGMPLGLTNVSGYETGADKFCVGVGEGAVVTATYLW